MSEIVLYGCLAFAVEAFTTMGVVRDELGVPYLRLDTDFSQSDKGRIETRLGAFDKGVQELEVLVDDDIAVSNVTRLLNNSACEYIKELEKASQ